MCLRAQSKRERRCCGLHGSIKDQSEAEWKYSKITKWIHGGGDGVWLRRSGFARRLKNMAARWGGVYPVRLLHHGIAGLSLLRQQEKNASHLKIKSWAQEVATWVSEETELPCLRSQGWLPSNLAKLQPSISISLFLPFLRPLYLSLYDAWTLGLKVLFRRNGLWIGVMNGGSLRELQACT